MELSERQEKTVASALTTLAALVLLAAVLGLCWAMGAFLRTFAHVFLPLAVAGATGISRGTAYTVPELLLDEIDGTSLRDLIQPTTSRCSFEGTTCHRIRGEHPMGRAEELQHLFRWNGFLAIWLIDVAGYLGHKLVDGDTGRCI